ncbi:MAG: hypothetical protein ACKVH8_15970 [Pirellulales bacterium]
MTREVTLEEVENAKQVVHELRYEFDSMSSQCRKRISEKRIAQTKWTIYPRLQSIRMFFESYEEWKLISLISVPSIFSGLSFVLSYASNGRVASNLSFTLLGAIFGSLLVCILIYYPSREIIDSTIQNLAEKLRELDAREEQAVAARNNHQQQLQTAQAHLSNCESQYSHLQKIQSKEHICKQLFNRNWRVMRSVEFEDYLQTVFETHGYSVETTSTSGD